MRVKELVEVLVLRVGPGWVSGPRRTGPDGVQVLCCHTAALQGDKPQTVGCGQWLTGRCMEDMVQLDLET